MTESMERAVNPVRTAPFGQTEYGVVDGLLHVARRIEPQLFQIAADEPERGSVILDQAEAEIEATVKLIRAVGPHGIAYVLRGAHPPISTPMEYGGFILERERDLLARLGESGPKLLLVMGSEPYLDFVSDLPAQIFGWDARSGYTVADVRALRNGPLAADLPDADVSITPAQIDFIAKEDA